MVRGYAPTPIADPESHRRDFQEMVKIQSGRDYGYTADIDEDNRLIELIRSHPQRPIILVYAPYHSSCFARFQHEDPFQAFKERLAAMPNVTLIDWSRRVYPDDAFIDPIHLNADGALRFSRELHDELRRRYAGKPEERYFPAEEASR
jgi:lysophospholipase L1-like esterase